MPELPDIVLYIESLTSRIVGETLETIRIVRPFVLRSVEPPIDEVFGKPALRVVRLGKRIAIGFEKDLFVVIHLMISGRLKWIVRTAIAAAGSRRGLPKAPVDPASGPPKIHPTLGLAALDFSNGTLLLTEASKKKRASLRIVRGEGALHALDPGGIEVLDVDLSGFRAALTRENHTLKRSLTDPRLFSGIGNAYSDEILHRARISPVKLTAQMSDPEIQALHSACREVLVEWIDRLRTEAGGAFPEKVTAFREEMAVHGRYRKPCPDCGAPVQRIVHAENETNYCPRCQTGGRILADRALSRLLKGDWPRTVEELEEMERRPEGTGTARIPGAVSICPERAARATERPTGPRKSRSKPLSP
jgi:formamidopyrimidine-DNA glycosylase